MKVKFKFREAKREDANKIAEVHIKSWRQAYKGIIHQSYLDNNLDVNERTKRWQENLSESKNGIFLVFDEEKLIGFSTVGKSRDDNYSDYAELYAIYLDPDYFGKGAGKALFQISLEYALAQGFRKMFVNVLSENKIGRDFYERMGAVPVENSEEEITIDGHSYSEMKYEWKELKG